MHQVMRYLVKPIIILSLTVILFGCAQTPTGSEDGGSTPQGATQGASTQSSPAEVSTEPGQEAEPGQEEQAAQNQVMGATSQTEMQSNSQMEATSPSTPPPPLEV